MPVIYISPYLANMQNEPNAKIYTTNLPDCKCLQTTKVLEYSDDRASIRTYVARQSKSFIICAYYNQPYLLLLWITRFKSLASKNPVVGMLKKEKL